MDHSTFELQYNRVFEIFKRNERIQDRNLNGWYQLWNRAYQSNRMKNDEYVEKWKALVEIKNFNSNIASYESYLKEGTVPSADSGNLREKKLAEWFKEQENPEKCTDSMKIDMLKSNYSYLFT